MTFAPTFSFLCLLAIPCVVLVRTGDGAATPPPTTTTGVTTTCEDSEAQMICENCMSLNASSGSGGSSACIFVKFEVDDDEERDELDSFKCADAAHEAEALEPPMEAGHAVEVFRTLRECTSGGEAVNGRSTIIPDAFTTDDDKTTTGPPTTTTTAAQDKNTTAATTTASPADANTTTANTTTDAPTTTAPVNTTTDVPTTTPSAVNTTTAAPDNTTTGPPATTTQPPDTTAVTTMPTTTDTSTKAPPPTTPKPSGRTTHFDGWSFFGGILLTAGFFAIAFIGVKYYRVRNAQAGNYNRF